MSFRIGAVMVTLPIFGGFVACENGSKPGVLVANNEDLDAATLQDSTVEPADSDVGPCARRPPGAPAGDPWMRERVEVDLPDDEPDAYQVHVLYVEPADRTSSPPLDVDGTIRRSLAAANAWFADRTGGLRLRFDTCGGTLDVTHVKLDAPYDEVAMASGVVGAPAGPLFQRDRLEAVLKAKFAAPKKLYLVYWDGLDFGHCGGAPLPPSLVGRFTVLYVGGVFRATFLSSAAAAGATQISVYSTTELQLPPVPFSALLGTEPITVTAVAPTSLSLQVPLASAHQSSEVLRGDTTIPPCRSNVLSRDGKELDYWEFSAAHEIMHALGIVPSNAPFHAPPPVATGHLSELSAAGRADVMYQGSSSWTCQTSPRASGPTATPCTLDPAHVNYFRVDGGTSVDLASSVFLAPTPLNAQLPPAW